MAAATRIGIASEISKEDPPPDDGGTHESARTGPKIVVTDVPTPGLHYKKPSDDEVKEDLRRPGRSNRRGIKEYTNLSGFGDEDYNLIDQYYLIEPDRKLDLLSMMETIETRRDIFPGVKTVQYWDAYSSFRSNRPRRFLFSGQNDMNLGSFKVEDAEIAIRPHTLFNTTEGSIYAPDLMDAPDRLLKKHLEKYKVKHIYRVTKRLQNGVEVPTPKINLTFESPKRPTYIKMEKVHLNLPVTPKYPNPMQCKKCFRYGHIQKRCSNDRVCAVCSQTGHTSTRQEPCTNTPLCVSCGSEHTNFYRKCEKYLKEKEVLATTLAQHIPFWEARKQVGNQTDYKRNVWVDQRRENTRNRYENGPTRTGTQQESPVELSNPYASLSEEDTGGAATNDQRTVNHAERDNELSREERRDRSVRPRSRVPMRMEQHNSGGTRNKNSRKLGDASAGAKTTATTTSRVGDASSGARTTTHSLRDASTGARTAAAGRVGGATPGAGTAALRLANASAGAKTTAAGGVGDATPGARITTPRAGDQRAVAKTTIELTTSGYKEIGKPPGRQQRKSKAQQSDKTGLNNPYDTLSEVDISQMTLTQQPNSEESTGKRTLSDDDESRNKGDKRGKKQEGAEGEDMETADEPMREEESRERGGPPTNESRKQDEQNKIAVVHGVTGNVNHSYFNRINR
ncbi:hypothetical protein SNEBB_007418 [Seison nebaliae]|nr:hypothetical protein SNEBB_007418 [Seison nebaliae]